MVREPKRTFTGPVQTHQSNIVGGVLLFNVVCGVPRSVISPSLSLPWARRKGVTLALYDVTSK